MIVHPFSPSAGVASIPLMGSRVLLPRPFHPGRALDEAEERLCIFVGLGFLPAGQGDEVVECQQVALDRYSSSLEAPSMRAASIKSTGSSQRATDPSALTAVDILSGR